MPTTATTAVAIAGVVTLVGLVALPTHHRTGLVALVGTAWAAASVIQFFALGRLARMTEDAQNRTDEILDGVDAVVWDGEGPAGDIDYVSDRVTEVFGFDAEDFRRSSFVSSRVHPDDLDEYISGRSRVAGGEDVQTHYRLRDRSGRLRHVHERITVSVDHAGSVRRRRGIIVDETARWEAESSMRGYLDFIEGLPLALAILRLDDPEDLDSLRVVVGNPSAAELVGKDREVAIGAALRDILPLNEDFTARLAAVVTDGQTFEWPAVPIGRNGEIYSVSAVPLPDRCIGVSLDDVTQRARTTETLRHQAQHDHLTGLANRARFNTRLRRGLRKVESGQQVAVMLIDLNGFKGINDSMGHEAGDKVLVTLAERLSSHMRSSDTIARLGGDEFAVLINDVDSAEAALGAAQRLASICAEPMQVDDFVLYVGASIGVSVAPEHGVDSAALLRHADAAMYRAKHAGGGALLHSSALDPTETSNVTLLAELNDALRSDELVLHYQPRIDLRSGLASGVEALVRWQHRERGMLAPSEFLELAEVSGTIQAITRAVLRRAVVDLSTIDADAPLALNINLSSRTLLDPSLCDWVEQILDVGNFPATSLCFEVAEPQLALDTAATLEALTKLTSLGVGFAVDDFGTGGSSLAYLSELPIDEVKVDLRFVADLDAGDDTAMRSAIALGHNLGLRVVAKGVEGERVLEHLRILGCDSAQGYHVAPPMPADELREFLRVRRTQRAG